MKSDRISSLSLKCQDKIFKTSKKKQKKIKQESQKEFMKNNKLLNIVKSTHVEGRNCVKNHSKSCDDIRENKKCENTSEKYL